MQSCEDALTFLPPNGLVKDEYWKTKEDVQSTLIGAYKGFARLDEELFYYGEIRADMLEEDNNLSGTLRNIMNSNIFPDNPYANWNSFYSIINHCNLVLKFAPDAKKEDKTFTNFKFDQYMAEAVFLRSLAYFYMVRIWRDVPFVLSPFDTDDAEFYIKKTKGSVILDSLDKQLERIVFKIPNEYEEISKTKARASRNAVRALLADIALWQFEYQKCVDYVEEIEDSELYYLMTSGKWFNIFSEGNTLEGIFEIQFDQGLGQSNRMYHLTNSQSNFFLASEYTMEILSPLKAGEAIRGQGTVREDKLIWKFIGNRADGTSFRSASERASCNRIVYRLADLLLMKAEALSQMSRFDEALAIVNEIRTRALAENITSHTQTPEAFEDLILEERAKELAFEGKRWFDLLRMGRRNNYARKNKLIEILIESAPATQKRVLAAKLKDPYGWYFPIYERELENNFNLVQNPYYQVFD